MFRANLYRRSSSFQQEDSAIIFDQFFGPLECEGFKSLLDIGCGPGETLIKICSKLSYNIKVVGIDVLEEMIILASKKYQSEALNFYVSDIQSDFNKINSNLHDKRFDLITSFYCYQWIRDER